MAAFPKTNATSDMIEFLILPAKEVRVGDVIFSNSGGVGVKQCCLVEKINPRPHELITEFSCRILASVDAEPGEILPFGFRHETPLGIARRNGD